MPTPASQPDAQPLFSPVPAQSVLARLSFGSSSSAPMLLCSNSRESHFQFGSRASALFVRQTPPPALAIQSRQLPPPPSSSSSSSPPFPQFGSMAPCVMRPLKSRVLALYSLRSRSGFGSCLAHVGPSGRHLPLPLSRRLSSRQSPVEFAMVELAIVTPGNACIIHASSA